jgi:hypothetical protein
MKFTSAAGRWSSWDVAIGSTHCNTQVYLLAAEKALAFHSRSLRRWHCTWGVSHDQTTHRFFLRRNFSARQTAYERHGILDSDLDRSSVRDSHKIPARQR